jgi:hypothetical protein
MITDRAEVTVIRGDLDRQQRDVVDSFVAEINRVFGVGRNEPRKEGAARVAQELADAPMTRRPRF